MSPDRWGDTAFYALMLILPLSALMARRLPIGTTLKMAAAWAAIFGIAIVAVVLGRDPITRAWNSIASGLGDQSVTGRTVRIRMANDGHFWADASINGVSRRMLIDSGATTTSLSVATAAAAGLKLDESPFPVMINTANGMVVARVSTAKAFQVGAISAREMGVVVAPEFGETDVIGMNFLSRLKAWRVEGPILVLEPAT
ncbi:TIGR02281 family clan AA aspartic protease [soil metagenome]